MSRLRLSVYLVGICRKRPTRGAISHSGTCNINKVNSDRSKEKLFFLAERFNDLQRWNLISVASKEAPLRPLPVMAFPPSADRAFFALGRTFGWQKKLGTSALAGGQTRSFFALPPSSFHYTCSICTCSWKRETFPC